MTPRKAAEAAAWQALDLARLTAADRGLRLPCAGRWDQFCAEDEGTRREAAQLCAGCPIFSACSAVVPYVTFGAWAGRVLPEDKHTTNDERTAH